ncbi:MAG: hypothetical protein ACREEK_07110 [Bradyrhizobium sp.]
MTNFKNSDRDAINLLDDAALEIVAGGVKDGGCIPGRPLPMPYPTGDWTFKDVFARWTIGK